MAGGENKEGQTTDNFGDYTAVAVAVAAQPQVTHEEKILGEVDATYGFDPRVFASRVITEVGP